MQIQLTGLGRALTPGAAAIALAVVVTLAPLPGSTAATAPATRAVTAQQAVPSVTQTEETVTARKRRFTPHSGVIVTNPLGDSRKRIMNHILKSIGATRRGQKIRIISWNIASREFVRKLINAHDRGVSVRLLMSQQKADDQPRDGDYWRLKRQLRDRNGQPRRLRSWARGCDRSCRGRRGIAHSKLFIFSRVGRAERVVMSTSANATDVAVYRQWNDLYTNVGSRRIYDGFMRTFRQATRDRPVANPYQIFRGRSVSGYVYPWGGDQARGDRVMNELRRIRCRGTRDGTGINGRTRIRIAQDAIINDRGVRIAKLLKKKWVDGCNIRVVYALLGRRARWHFMHNSRGVLPHRQIVQDWDDDGVYDRYLHAKVMAVNGRYRRDRSARVAWQGSENWSGLAKLSDEQGFKIERRNAERKYTRWVDWMYQNPPPRREVTTTLRTARARGVDPYALIKEELGLTEAAAQDSVAP